jgi:hypothetical protein
MSFPIGHVTEYEHSIDICAKCEARIGTGDLCSYGCPDDGEANRVIVRRTFKRVETIVREDRIEFKRITVRA